MKQTIASMEWKASNPKSSFDESHGVIEYPETLLSGTFLLLLFILVFQNSAAFGAELRFDQVLVLTHRANN
jgi:hypothetical protein